MTRAVSDLPMPVGPVMRTGRIRGARMGDGGERGLHRGRGADEQRRLGRLHLRMLGTALRRRGVHQRAQRALQFPQIERFHEVAGSPALLGLDRVLQVSMRGDDEHRQFGIVFADARERIQPAHVRKTDVENDERRFRL